MRWVEVTDQGGCWTADEHDDEQGRGLTIVAAIAGDGNWGIDGDAASRTQIVLRLRTGTKTLENAHPSVRG